MGRAIWLALVVAGCTGGGSGGHDGYYLAGECDPATGTVPVTATALFVQDNGCLQGTATELSVVESLAQWDALFSCPTEVPAGLDFATSRAAVAHVQCTPLSLRFVAESDAEIAVGIVTGVSGACIDDPLVVPLAASAKPVRIAECRQQCDDCPPVP